MSETRASSSPPVLFPPASPLVSDRFAEPTTRGTFILHDYKGSRILVESDAGITVFLSKDDVKSRKTNPQQYHWHCIHRDGCFRFRNAFSKKMLCLKDFYDGRHERCDWLVKTVHCDQAVDSEFYLAVSKGAFTLLCEIDALLHPVSVAYDDRFDFLYPIVREEPDEQDRVVWKFERVENGIINGIEVNYGPDDYENFVFLIS